MRRDAHSFGKVRRRSDWRVQRKAKMNVKLISAAWAFSLALGAPALAAQAGSTTPPPPSGAIVLPAISYTVLHAGPPEGASPKRTDTVIVNYELKLTDGSVVDSSFARGEPSEFPLKSLIPAWQVVVPLMKPGDEWQVVVPPQFAYGARAKEGIPANSTLIFRIVLLSVKPPTD